MVLSKGDSVQVTYPGYYFDGRTGYVEYIDDRRAASVLVDLGNGESWFHPNELTLLHKEENTVSVSVGDRVKHTFYGHEGEVTYIYKDGVSAIVDTGGKEVVCSICYLVAIPESAKRNPNAPDFALTLDDIKPGVKLRRVHPHLDRKIDGGAITITGEPYETVTGEWRVKTSQHDYFGSGFSLADMGVVAYARGNWNTNYCIPDTTDAVVKVLQK